MFLIAERFGVSLSDLEAANPQITDPSNISVGTVLNIPAGGTVQTPPTTSPGRIHYSGPASNFPSPNQWKSFSDLWAQNLTTFQVNDSFNEISSIQTSIVTVANESGVDPRVILCVIMHESSGNVRVQPTLSPGTPPVRNTGLMQSHNGVEFNPSDPNGSIFQMIKDGTEGTPFGDGLQQCISRFGNVYEGLRAYNSGSVVEADLSDGRGATPDYVSDVAYRLVGAV
jgi:hypothetical protein